MYCIELAVDLFFPLFVANLRSTGSLLLQFLFTPDLILLPSPAVSVANLLLSAACPRQQKLSSYRSSLSEQLTFSRSLSLMLELLFQQSAFSWGYSPSHD
jgi:hypothetical protein